MPASGLQQVALGVVAVATVAAVGALYVVYHEARRQIKKEALAEAAAEESSSGEEARNLGTPDIEREKLLAILHEASNASYGLIAQTRKMCHEKAQQTGVSITETVDEFQKDFESALEAVVKAVRDKHGVSEQQLAYAMGAQQHDSEVAAAIAGLRAAMAGNPPPSYGQLSSAEQAAAAAAVAKRKERRGRRKG